MPMLYGSLPASTIRLINTIRGIHIARSSNSQNGGPAAVSLQAPDTDNVIDLP